MRISQRNNNFIEKKHRRTCTAQTSSMVGKASSAGLLVLMFMLVNPFVGLEAKAMENPKESENTATQADITEESRVSIALTPTAVSGEMTPTTETGIKKQLGTTATITINTAENYAIYIGAETTGLVGRTNGATINSLQTATNYNDLPANSWGIYYGEGYAVPENASYKPVEKGRGTVIDAGGRLTSTLTKSYSLGFAANINNQVPADIYENKVTLSVVSSPLEISDLTGITNMQDMTSDICTSSAEGSSKQLKDTRDGKYYWVAKLADGKCWMTQNLDLDLSASVALTPETSDVSSNWTPGFSTTSQATSSTVNSNSSTETRSWDLGNYRIKNPTVSSDCPYPKNDGSQCSQLTSYTTPTSANGDINAHYILGNHYQWNAATAGTGGSIISGQATSSICPRGWKLPTSTSSGEFQTLITAGSIGSNVAKLTSAPYYFASAGFVSQNPTLLFAYSGGRGFFWSSTPSGTYDGIYAYYLTFSNTNQIGPSYNTTRADGYSVRCLAH